MSHANFKEFTLSIYPNTKGFAFVLFEGPLSPYDWGIKEFPGKEKNAATLDAIQHLVDRYRPDDIIIEDWTAPGSRRSPRIRRLYRAIEKLAEEERVNVRRITREEVQRRFAESGALTKYQIAEKIALNLPMFARYLPPVRKPWMSEDRRMSLFEAVALGLARGTEVSPQHLAGGW